MSELAKPKPEDKITIVFEQGIETGLWYFRMDCPWHHDQGGPYLTRTNAVIAAGHILNKSTAFH